jgi:hypothetical protein
MSISPLHHRPHIHLGPKTNPTQTLLANVKQDYQRNRMDQAKLYKPIADPETDKSLRGTAALKLYQATLGEGHNLDECTDGDHLAYRRSTGEIVIATFPEDSSRGDGLWVFDKTGQKLLGHAVALDGKLAAWDPKK